VHVQGESSKPTAFEDHGILTCPTNDTVVYQQNVHPRTLEEGRLPCRLTLFVMQKPLPSQQTFKTPSWLNALPPTFEATNPRR
jgi:hypothetical protein